MKTLIIIISTVILFVFTAPAFAQEYTINHQIEILNLKLEIVRLKKGVWLERVKQAIPLRFRIEETKLVDEIGKLTDLKVKQEADKKAEEGKE